MKRIDYSFPKWEKRKNKLLSYEIMTVQRINNLIESTEGQSRTGIKELYLLSLSYAEIVVNDYIRQRKDDFEEHLYELLRCIKECVMLLGTLEGIPEATRRSLTAELQAGYWGYYALISLDFYTVTLLANQDSYLMRLLEQKTLNVDPSTRDEITDMLEAIADRDPVKFNQALKNRIQSNRKMSSDYILCLDIWAFALIRYAEYCGMKVDRNRYVEADLDKLKY